jgi:hypothetical protein
MRVSPNLYMMFFHKRKMTLLVVISISVFTFTHLVKFLTATKISCLFPKAFKNGPNIFIPYCEKGHIEEMVVNLAENW